jgi:SAM-dependent methyltransferase
MLRFADHPTAEMNQGDAEISELKRIVAVYRERQATVPAGRDSMTTPAVLFVYQQRSRAILRTLAAQQLLPLRDKRILDVGCGSGQSLIDFESWGARRDNLAGIDLLESSVHLSRLRLCSPGRAADIRVGNAGHLPWPDRTFDIVNQSTIFTSILSVALRRSVAQEMVRVARPGGVILWYDFKVNNPSNPDVRRVGAAEIRSMFPECEVRLQSLTLAPPIARRLVPVSWTAALLLEKMRVLNTHYLGVIRVPLGTGRSATRGPA